MKRLLQLIPERLRPWTEEEIEIAARRYAHRWNGYGARLAAIRRIAEELGRTDESVASRLRHCGETFRRPRSEHAQSEENHPGRHRRPDDPKNHQVATPRNAHIPDDVLADRDRRARLDHETFTAAFFGDPLPGYSARDRR